MMYNSHGNHSEFRQFIPVGNSAYIKCSFILWPTRDQRISTPILEYMLDLNYADPSP
jgi:hypothetical protein